MNARSRWLQMDNICICPVGVAEPCVAGAARRRLRMRAATWCNGSAGPAFSRTEDARGIVLPASVGMMASSIAPAHRTRHALSGCSATARRQLSGAASPPKWLRKRPSGVLMRRHCAVERSSCQGLAVASRPVYERQTAPARRAFLALVDETASFSQYAVMPDRMECHA